MFALRKPSLITTLAAVCLFAITPLIFVLSQSGFSHMSKLVTSHRYWLFIFFYIGIYFLLHKWVVPHLYLAKKWLLFGITVLALLALSMIVKPFDRLAHFYGRERTEKKFEGKGEFPGPEQRMPGEPGNRFEEGKMKRGPFGPAFDIVSLFLMLMVLLTVIAEAATRQSRLTEQRAIQAEADRVHAELSFLKAQINPHFLFNTLNNIYSLAVTKNERTADAVMKLSNIMRYVTDGANEQTVPLEDEANCIEDYISLQKLRLGENFPVSFTISGDIIQKVIPPLVLMTFVENAFKHGVSNHEENSIVFKIQLQDKYIHFFAQNKLFSTARNTERTGIGIDNTKKRLNVLYPGKHLLDIEEKEGFYTVDLVLYT